MLPDTHQICVCPVPQSLGDEPPIPSPPPHRKLPSTTSYRLLNSSLRKTNAGLKKRNKESSLEQDHVAFPNSRPWASASFRQPRPLPVSPCVFLLAPNHKVDGRVPLRVQGERDGIQASAPLLRIIANTISCKFYSLKTAPRVSVRLLENRYRKTVGRGKEKKRNWSE